MLNAGDHGHIVIRGGWVLVAAGFVLGFLYLRYHNQVVEASCRLKEQEAYRTELREQAELTQVHLEQLKSPGAIKSRLGERGLAMALPREDQIVRVKKDSAGVPPAAAVIASAAR
jgi:hypothetical protein